MQDLAVKLLWRGEECWNEFLNLLNVAEDAAAASSHAMDVGPHGEQNTDRLIVRKKLVDLIPFLWVVFIDFHDFPLLRTKVMRINPSFILTD